MSRYYPILLAFLFPFACFSQESIELSNGDKLVGDIQLLDHGVLEIETDYSEDNFTMDWGSVVKLSSPDQYIIQLSDGQRESGSINLENEIITITLEDSTTLQVEKLDLVYLKSVSSGFWDRMSIALDGGYTISKANDSRQFTLRGNASYLSTVINPDIYFNFTRSTLTDDAAKIETERDNYGGNLKVFIIESWFGLGGADFLKSSEQALNLRATYKFGTGIFLVQNHKMYLSTAAGLALNNEDYTDPTVEVTNSKEAFFGADFNAFGLNDFNLTTSATVYPSLTETDRYRINYTIDAKIDLPKDLYLGAGYTLNYDSQPLVEGTATNDYVFSTTIGWSL